MANGDRRAPILHIDSVEIGPFYEESDDEGEDKVRLRRRVMSAFVHLYAIHFYMYAFQCLYSLSVP